MNKEPRGFILVFYGLVIVCVAVGGILARLIGKLGLNYFICMGLVGFGFIIASLLGEDKQ